MEKEILKLIKGYSRDFDISAQRAELVSRNRAFLDELKALKDHNSVINFSEMLEFINEILEANPHSEYPITRINKRAEISLYSHLKWPEILGPRSRHIEIFLGQWLRFCRQWNIKPEWDGEISSLRLYMEPPLEFFWVEGEEDDSPALLARINSWTTLKDMKSAWGQVENLQNTMWRKQEKRSNFSRDLCWYDLRKRHGLSLNGIAKLWAKYFPQEVDLLVVRRMKADIPKADLLGRRPNDEELLREIKCGFLSAKYRTEYQAQRKYYLKGESLGKNFNSPFVDAIKKATARMEQQINQPAITSLKTTMTLETVLKRGKAMTLRS